MSQSDPAGQSTAGIEPDTGTGHPLFPRPETATGPDNRKFDLIQIRRIGPDGKVEICPKYFRGCELRSWEQVYEAYGGGTYQLVAQDGKTHTYTAWSEK